MTDKDSARTSPCPRCGMTFRIGKPKGSHSIMTRCAEPMCFRRFGHSSKGRYPAMTWVETDPEIDRVVAAAAQ